MLGFTYGQPNLLDLMLLKKSLNLEECGMKYIRDILFIVAVIGIVVWISNSSNFWQLFWQKNDEVRIREGGRAYNLPVS